MIELPRTSIIASPLYMPVLENNEIVNFQPVTPKAGEYVALIFRKGFVSTNILLTKGSLYGKEKGLFADFDRIVTGRSRTTATTTSDNTVRMSTDYFRI